ncbi:hypothetical protein [Bacillus sp. T33-2]|uniref:hypothetical protein n=1 Tax=Bacillus sp. T33-2 TaxID=2054168 RepID=UPI0015E10117|nr:hypothetical protein [Bacillus sp. T33-2]
MEKDNFNEELGHPNHQLKRNSKDGILEISPTGYGLQAVSEGASEDKEKGNTPGCGGL